MKRLGLILERIDLICRRTETVGEASNEHWQVKNRNIYWIASQARNDADGGCVWYPKGIDFVKLPMAKNIGNGKSETKYSQKSTPYNDKSIAVGCEYLTADYRRGYYSAK